MRSGVNFAGLATLTSGTVISEEGITLIQIQTQQLDGSGVLLVLNGMVLSAQQTVLPSVKAVSRSLTGDAIATLDISLVDLSSAKITSLIPVLSILW